mmetsp:Transcript_12042/g.41766  ORF Transcript_12042/g.41766 Transcript_12042/m.41766 type:complete len:305 (+) Transcript_12042:136-1050(+)
MSTTMAVMSSLLTPEYFLLSFAALTSRFAALLGSLYQLQYANVRLALYTSHIPSDATTTLAQSPAGTVAACASGSAVTALAACRSPMLRLRLRLLPLSSPPNSLGLPTRVPSSSWKYPTNDSDRPRCTLDGAHVAPAEEPSLVGVRLGVPSSPLLSSSTVHSPGAGGRGAEPSLGSGSRDLRGLSIAMPTPREFSASTSSLYIARPGLVGPCTVCSVCTAARNSAQGVTPRLVPSLPLPAPGPARASPKPSPPALRSLPCALPPPGRSAMPPRLQSANATPLWFDELRSRSANLTPWRVQRSEA